MPTSAAAGGLLCESLAARGAAVLGIDASADTLAAARAHLEESGLHVDYRAMTAEALAESHSGRFDLVTCMELIEHVPDAAGLVAACARLVRPGGTVVFSTINRNPRSYALAIVAAEYVLGMLPQGTHDYARFVRPSELAAWGRAAGLRLADVTGVAWSALTDASGCAGTLPSTISRHSRPHRADELSCFTGLRCKDKTATTLRRMPIGACEHACECIGALAAFHVTGASGPGIEP